jgi:hypothetical protein
MLVGAIVVASDGTGADIGASPDGRVANIAQVIGLGAGLDHGFLDLDEVADVHVILQARTGPQTSVRPDHRAFAHMRAVEMRKRADKRIVLDYDARPEHHELFYHHVAAELGV